MSLLQGGEPGGLPVKPVEWREYARAAPRGLRWLWRMGWAIAWLNFGLRRSALLQLLEIAAAFSIPIAVVTFLLGAPDRSRERLYRSSEIISKPADETTDAARLAAMEDLASQNLALTRVQVPDSAYLWGIDLRGAVLHRARMRSANLYGAKLGCRKRLFSPDRCVLAQYVDWTNGGFWGADLRGANLWGAWLLGGELTRARLDETVLVYAHFERSRLLRASLTEARMLETSFDWADLREADLSGSNLERVDFTGADLRGASFANVRNWRTIASLRWANVANLRSAPPGFLAWVRDSSGAVVIEDDSAWTEFRAAKRKEHDLLTELVRDMGTSRRKQ